MAKKKMARSVNTIRNSIKKILESSGVYSKMYDMAIDDLATVTHLKERVFIDATEYEYPEQDELNRENTGAIVIEKSREGEYRYKTNPIYLLYLDFVRESQKILESLGMTIKSSEGVDDDNFNDLADTLKKAINGEKRTDRAKK